MNSWSAHSLQLHFSLFPAAHDVLKGNVVESRLVVLLLRLDLQSALFSTYGYYLPCQEDCDLNKSWPRSVVVQGGLAMERPTPWGMDSGAVTLWG